MSTNILDLGQVQHTSPVQEPGLFEILSRPRGYRSEELLRQVQSNIQFLERKLKAAPDRVQNAVLIDPRVMHGNPVFRGTRIPIYQVVEELADGTPFEELTEGYPSLTAEGIRDGLDFVACLLRIYDEKIPR
jgi:uncharacterized protein (DUF433 family)